MALPLPPGLTPPEVAFLCEMELVTVIPRQRLEGLQLLGPSYSNANVAPTSSRPHGFPLPPSIPSCSSKHPALNFPILHRSLILRRLVYRPAHLSSPAPPRTPPRTLFPTTGSRSGRCS
ncbi:MAG: hypothetical protein Q9197_007056 [Variospora fuerteventurae]